MALSAARPAPGHRPTLWIFLCGLALTLLATWPAQAQPRRPNPEELRERFAAQTADVLQQLNLTDAQAATVRPLLEARDEKALALVEQARAQRSREAMQAMRADMAALDEATEKQLADVLTEPQQATYRTLLKERAEQRRGRRRR